MLVRLSSKEPHGHISCGPTTCRRDRRGPVQCASDKISVINPEILAQLFYLSFQITTLFFVCVCTKTGYQISADFKYSQKCVPHCAIPKKPFLLFNLGNFLICLDVCVYSGPGEAYEEPRLTCWYGELPYTYARSTMAANMQV